MKGKKIIAVGLIVGSLSTVFAGCGKSSASIANLSDQNAKNAIAAVSQTEILKQNDFKMPSIIGDDFFENKTLAFNRTSTRAHYRNGVQIGDMTYKFDENYNEPVNVYSNNAYKSKFYNRESLKNKRTNLDAHIDSLNDLYLVAADIQAANLRIETLRNEIKTEAEALRKNARVYKKNNKSKVSGDNSEFADYSAALKKSTKELKRNRGTVKKQIKRLPKNTSTYVGKNALTNRYKLILNKMEERLNAMEAIKVNLGQMNEFLNRPQAQTAREKAQIERFRKAEQSTERKRQSENIHRERKERELTPEQIERRQQRLQRREQRRQEQMTAENQTIQQNSEFQVQPIASQNIIQNQETKTDDVHERIAQRRERQREYQQPIAPYQQPDNKESSEQSARERMTRIREKQMQRQRERQRERTNQTPHSHDYQGRRRQTLNGM